MTPAPPAATMPVTGPSPGAADRERASSRRQGRSGEPLGSPTSAGPAYGPTRHCDVTGTIDLREAIDQSSPIGMAFCIGENAAGVAVWSLSIRGRNLPGGRVVLHRPFVPA